MPENVDWVLDHFSMPNHLFERLSKVYPTFKQELPKMEMWYLANPKKRKKNHYRFIINWMNRIRQEKVVVRSRRDDDEFKKKVEIAEKEAAPPPPEFYEMMKKLKGLK